MGSRARTLTVALLAAAVLLAGCELRADVELRVERDGAGTFAVVLEEDEALRSEASAAGFDLGESIAEAVEELDGWEATVTGGQVRLETSFDDPEELGRSSAAFAEALAAPELRPLEPFEVALTETHVTVTGAAGLEPTGQASELPLPGDPVSALGDAVDYTVSVELPGEVVSHNADRLSDNWLLWEVAAGEQVEVAAEAELPPAPARWPWALAAAAVVLVVAALVARRRRRRRWTVSR